MQIDYRWMVTPAELFACFVPTHTADNALTVPTLGFPGGRKKPLSGTPYLYQLGVSDTSVAVDIKPVLAAFPDLPTTGDSRSGVILYHGNIIIGAYTIPGQVTNNLRRIVVREGYQGQGLATRMVEQWFREIPGPLNMPRQPINVRAVKAFLTAHKNLVEWAVANGKPVPQKVRDAVASGAEAEGILKRLVPVENAPARRTALRVRRR